MKRYQRYLPVAVLPVINRQRQRDELILIIYANCFLFIDTNIVATASDLDSVSEGRHKRGPTVGLFAFPRVGRSDPDLLEWSDAAAVAAALPLELADDYGKVCCDGMWNEVFFF